MVLDWIWRRSRRYKTSTGITSVSLQWPQNLSIHIKIDNYIEISPSREVGTYFTNYGPTENATSMGSIGVHIKD